MAFGLGPDHIVKELDDIIEGLATVEYSDEMDAEGLEAANDYTDEQIAALSGGGIVGWHEISRGTFHVGATIDINKKIAQPNAVGDPGEAAHEHTNPYSKPFIHVFVDASGTVLDLAGEEFVWEEADAIEYRVTATIDGTKYQSDSMKGPHNYVQAGQPDGSFVTVGSWIFSANGIPAPADVGDYNVQLVVEAFGEISALPDDLVHQADLVGLASEAYVDSAIDAIPEVETPEIPSIEGLATVEYSDEMDAQVLATAKRYSDSVVAIEAGDNEIAQTYLQNPDVEGYKMTYWHSNATNPGGEIHASNIKNANGGFAYVRAKANENWGWLCIHEDYLGKSVDLDLHGLKSFWFKDWGNERFYVSKYGQTAPTPPEGAAWHSSGVSVSLLVL